MFGGLNPPSSEGPSGSFVAFLRSVDNWDPETMHSGDAFLEEESRMVWWTTGDLTPPQVVKRLASVRAITCQPGHSRVATPQLIGGRIVSFRYCCGACGDEIGRILTAPIMP